MSEKIDRSIVLTKKTFFERIKKLAYTRELFTFGFTKTIFMKLFICRRYEREGDLHVWPDDHIEWDKIRNICKKSNSIIIEENDYLLYRPKVSIENYNLYKEKCNDMKYIFAKKHLK